MHNLDFNEILKNVHVQKSVSPTRIALVGVIIVILIYFAFSFNNLNQRKKEIECIEYYNALGIKLNGCNNVIDNYIKHLEDE